MIPHPCTATSCPSCGHRFFVDATRSTATWGSTATWSHDYSRFRAEVEALPTKIELAHARAARIQAMARQRIEQTPRPRESLNAGMHIRRMRRSAGLSRARAV